MMKPSEPAWKPTTLTDGDPQGQALTELAQHLGEIIRTENGDAAEKREQSDALTHQCRKTVKKENRSYSRKVAVAALTLATAVATGAYQYGGPAEQTEKADAAVEHVDEKMVQLDKTTKELEALKADIEAKRQARVSGRLTGVEQRVASVEGRQAGLDSKVDVLLDAALSKTEAAAAKVTAAKAKEATEAAAKIELAIDAMAE